ncbi:MAG: NnrS family protein [Xanthomonadales bacterium]|nr:NnrS family protein [Xanthomonadales bacterium]
MTGPAIWLLGFRPFFLGAALFAMLSMAVWLAVYGFGWPLEISGVSRHQWHAHEMIYGYSMAVVAGFLLTAARNWTGLETLQGRGLAGLFVLWLLPRLLLLQGARWLPSAAIADLAFMLILTAAIARPVLQVRQYRQLPVLLILLLLTFSSGRFYLAALSGEAAQVSASLYAGLYLVLALILFMGRRVIPFFTERGVDYPVELGNARWNDGLSWLLFPAFLVAEVFFPHRPAGAVLAGLLFLLNGLRLAGWYTPGIWRKPLLWSLYLAYLLITLGFGLRALQPLAGLPLLMPVHAFALGGIGLVTISMMPRVSLGHTGRSVHEPPAGVPVFIGIMALAAASRVLLSWLDPSRYLLWVTLSGLLWILAFGLFALSIGPMLLRQRIDAKMD